ncbi:MAG: Na/Pi cotransporter family protein [Alphaproteobacteria bacterium]|nr:Na/Pi cotransporter family protein [Alphaproteobacteria bacterium]
MNLVFILVQLAGAVMLLLYSVRMVRTGVERASGPALRRAIANPARGRLASAAVGGGVAILLQSATATSVLAAGFAAGGLVTIGGGLAMLLGADLGTAIVVQFLSLNLTFLIPVLLLAGGWLFLKFDARVLKQIGRVFMGIAFILLALKMIGEATTPLKQSEFMPFIAGYLAGDYVTAFIAGVVFTFMIHSSVAAVLMIAAFSAQGILPFEAGLPLILGANVGGGLIAVWLTRGLGRVARRLPLGNLIFRSTGALLVLLVLGFFDLPFLAIGADASRQVVNFHLAFNLALLLLCLPFIAPMEKLVKFLLPEIATPEDAAERLRPASALDRTVMDQPGLALASATRELLRMSELVEVMIRPVMEFFETGDRVQIERIRRLDSQVNEAHTEIKLYIAQVNRGALTATDSERGMELTSFAINLERVGDIVAKNLLNLVLVKHKKGLRFSDDGWKELTNLHDRVMANMQLALNVLVSEDIESARQLIVEKDRMRKLERQSHERHLARLKGGAVESIESSDAHLEIVRSLREINSLFATIAVSILSRHGLLRDTRLVEVEDGS